MVFSRQASTKFPWKSVGSFYEFCLSFRFLDTWGTFCNLNQLFIFKNAWKSLTSPTFTPLFTLPTQTFSET